MIQSLPIPYDVDVLAWALAGLLVALLAAARIHSSDRWWCPEIAWFWHPIRKYALPPLDYVLDRVPMAFAKSYVYEAEVLVTGLELTIEELRADLADAGHEVQPLASLATFDPSSDLGVAGETERGSYARYFGPRVGEGIVPEDVLRLFPYWLTAKYQVHARPFGDDGDLTLTAHLEYNPFNPIYALPHLLGIGLDAESGVEKLATDLEIDPDTGS